MRNKDLLDFLLSNKDRVPLETTNRVMSYISLSLNPARYLWKFYAANLLGGLLTLIICPQYGFWPYGGPEGFFHYIMSFGPVWCGLFCAGVFFTGANILSIAVSSPIEREWVHNHKASVILPWITVLLFLGMLAESLATPGTHRHQDASFYVSWYTGALLLTSATIYADKLRVSRRWCEN